MEEKEKPLENLPIITFKNQPKLSPYEVDAKFNERRMALIPHIEEYISSNDRFKGKEVSVTFFDKGVSSLVGFIETPDEKLVLKIALSLAHSLGSAEFLKAWEVAGVRVPHVIDSGMFGEHSFDLIEYIDAPVLSTAYSKEEIEAKGIRFQMGATLRKMHSPRALGFGRLLEGKAEFENFRDWLYSAEVEKKIKYVLDNNLLEGAGGSIEKAREVLLRFAGEGKESSFCHDDFGMSNIFATDPITVFDPNPRFNIGYLDLGKTIANQISSTGSFSTSDEIINGYFGGEPYDREALNASILLNIHLKLPYQHKTNRVNKIENYKKYLSSI
ncbi:MAG: aminoglycoside phosphotransferase family protein [bacterium]